MNNFHGKTKNKGPKLPLNLKEYQRIRKIIRGENTRYQTRNLLLVNFQVNSSLRVGDLLKLTVGDIHNGNKFRSTLWVEQEKTGQQVNINILDCMIEELENAKSAYELLFGERYFDDVKNPLFPSHQRQGRAYKPLGYTAYLMMFKKWIAEIGLEPEKYGTHSLRATVPINYFQKTGDIVTTSKLFGHARIATTSIYLEKIAKEKASEVRHEFYFSD